jgi:hypothetical protein
MGKMTLQEMAAKQRGDYTLSIPGPDATPFLLKSVGHVGGRFVWLFTKDDDITVWDYADAWKLLQRCKLDHPDATLAIVRPSAKKKV